MYVNEMFEFFGTIDIYSTNNQTQKKFQLKILHSCQQKTKLYLEHNILHYTFTHLFILYIFIKIQNKEKNYYRISVISI